jgi:hypothetical protein
LTSCFGCSIFVPVLVRPQHLLIDIVKWPWRGLKPPKRQLPDRRWCGDARIHLAGWGVRIRPSSGCRHLLPFAKAQTGEGDSCKMRCLTLSPSPAPLRVGEGGDSRMRALFCRRRKACCCIARRGALLQRQSDLQRHSAYTNQGAISSVGRALRLHRRCREFESLIAHHQVSDG